MRNGAVVEIPIRISIDSTGRNAGRTKPRQRTALGSRLAERQIAARYRCRDEIRRLVRREVCKCLDRRRETVAAEYRRNRVSARGRQSRESKRATSRAGDRAALRPGQRESDAVQSCTRSRNLTGYRISDRRRTRPEHLHFGEAQIVRAAELNPYIAALSVYQYRSRRIRIIRLVMIP